MIAHATVALFFLAALVAIGSIALAVATILPRARELKLALAEEPQQRELRFTVREMIVVPARGKVVALPLRFKQPVPQPLRAAA